MQVYFNKIMNNCNCITRINSTHYEVLLTNGNKVDVKLVISERLAININIIYNDDCRYCAEPLESATNKQLWTKLVEFEHDYRSNQTAYRRDAAKNFFTS